MYRTRTTRATNKRSRKAERRGGGVQRKNLRLFYFQKKTIELLAFEMRKMNSRFNLRAPCKARRTFGRICDRKCISQLTRLLQDTMNTCGTWHIYSRIQLTHDKNVNTGGGFGSRFYVFCLKVGYKVGYYEIASPINPREYAYSKNIKTGISNPQSFVETPVFLDIFHSAGDTRRMPLQMKRIVRRPRKTGSSGW